MREIPPHVPSDFRIFVEGVVIGAVLIIAACIILATALRPVHA